MLGACKDDLSRSEPDPASAEDLDAAKVAADEGQGSIGPRCRELIEQGMKLAGREPIELQAGREVRLDEAKCVDVLRAVEVVDPSMRASVFAHGLQLIMVEAGLMTQADIDAMRHKAMETVAAGDVPDTPLPAKDAGLPRARGQSFYVDRPFRVRVSAGTAVIDGERVDPSDAAALRSRIAVAKQKVVEKPVASVVYPLMGPALHADALLPFGTVADVMRAAVASDLTDFTIAVRDGDALRQTAVSSPPEPPVDAPKVEVGSATLRFAGKPVADLDALGSAAASFVVANPDQTMASLVIERDVPMQRVVEVLEVLRGCTMDGAMIGEEVPSECALWQASVSDGG